jgi:hypothetical protein
MDQEILEKIELAVARALSKQENALLQQGLALRSQITEELGGTREYLQVLFKYATWAASVLFLAGGLAFSFLFADSMSAIRQDIASQVTQKMIDYRIMESYKERLGDQLDLALAEPEVVDRIELAVREEVDSQLAKKLDSIIEEKFADMESAELKEILIKIYGDRLHDMEMFLQGELRYVIDERIDRFISSEAFWEKVKISAQDDD